MNYVRKSVTNSMNFAGEKAAYEMDGEYPAVRYTGDLGENQNKYIDDVYKIMYNAHNDIVSCS